MDTNVKNLEYIGEVSLVTDVRIGQPRRSSIYLKLTYNNHLVIIFPQDSQLQSIPIKSIMRIHRCSHLSNNTVELKWIDPGNSSIVSTYIEFATRDERENWLHRLFSRRLAISSASLIDLLDDKLDWIDSCQIDAMGELLTYSETSRSEKIFIVLVSTLDSQVEKYFKKEVVVFNLDSERPSFVEIDARKIVILIFNLI